MRLSIQRNVAQIARQIGTQPPDLTPRGVPVRHALWRAVGEACICDQGDAHGAASYRPSPGPLPSLGHGGDMSVSAALCHPVLRSRRLSTSRRARSSSGQRISTWAAPAWKTPSLPMAWSEPDAEQMAHALRTRRRSVRSWRVRSEPSTVWPRRGKTSGACTSGDRPGRRHGLESCHSKRRHCRSLECTSLAGTKRSEGQHGGQQSPTAQA